MPVWIRRVPSVLAASGALLLAGCGTPEGVDGDLTGQWVGMPEPASFVPAAEVCHAGHSGGIVRLSEYRPVPCDEPHRLETVHVGAFTGETADRHTPPPPGSPELREAFAECDARAADFLGGDFRSARLTLGVVRPSERAWSGGARWFRCDVAEWEDYERFRTVRRTGSLRDELAGESPLRRGCFDPTFTDGGGLVEEMNPVDCDESHSTEFVGAWLAPDTLYMDVDDEEVLNRAHRECLSVVADYVDVPDDADLPFRVSTLVAGPGEEQWEAGDRGFLCYLYLWNRKVTESLADAGQAGLPVQ